MKYVILALGLPKGMVVYGTTTGKAFTSKEAVEYRVKTLKRFYPEMDFYVHDLLSSDLSEEGS